MDRGDVFICYFREALLRATEKSNHRITIIELNDYFGMSFHVPKHLRPKVIDILIDAGVLLPNCPESWKEFRVLE
jgi:hypothetical protein